MTGATRTYRRVKNAEHLPGLREDDEVIDVSSFQAHELFVAEGKPNASDFYLSSQTWLRLGKPDRISVTVAAL